MADTATPLSTAELGTLKKAAYGAVQLLSLAHPGALSTTKENMAGAAVLSGALTPLVSQALTSKSKVPIKGTAAEVAAEVLPALRDSVAILQVKAPDETDEFRRVVLTAVQTAAQATKAGPRPGHSEIIGKINNALAAH